MLKSIDYHDLIIRYGCAPSEIVPLLKIELIGLLNLKPDCFMICCNTLHKYYDLLKQELNPTIPIFHPIELTKKYIQKKKYNKILFLATKFTMEDGFFSDGLRQEGLTIVIPNETERNEMQSIHEELMRDLISEKSKNYFKNLINKYKNLDAVVIACSEWNLVVNAENSSLPLIDTLYLQCAAAVEYSLGV